MPNAITSLASMVGGRLQSAGMMMVTAESCTGGLVAGAITEIACSSAWFERGYVTYSNEAKQELLGVKAETLATHGAVSEPVAREMAEGALTRSRAQVAVAVTGIAGPDGGTPEKPVGTVCFGWARRSAQGAAAILTETRTETCRFTGDRAAVRRQAIEHALRGVVDAV